MVTAAEKAKARKALSHAVEDGKIAPQPCEKCGTKKSQAHHEDYGKPLEIRWWCARCHSQYHNQKHPVTKVCVVCGREFTPHPTKRKRAKTCSPECRSALISESLKANPVVPPWAKLDKALADRIRERYASGGISQRALGREFNIHHSQIGAIVRGEAWK